MFFVIKFKTSKIKSMKLLDLKTCQNMLLHHTAKFLSKELAAIQLKLANEDISLESQEALSKKTLLIQSYLKRQLYRPVDQSLSVNLGNGITVLINGEEKEFFVDSFVVGNCRNIISLASPFGISVFGKNVGEKGTYITPGGESRDFILLKIIPYLKAKDLLKMKTRALSTIAA